MTAAMIWTRRAALVVGMVLGLFLAAGTTTASAAKYTYDAPAIERVGVHQGLTVEAGPARLSHAPEGLSVESRGTSTTSSRSFIATNTRMSGATTVGETDLATSNMRKFSTNNPEAGYYDVVGHGSPNDLAGLSPGQLADRISGPAGGQNIRLLSCQTGCPTGTFAQDLADNLGVRVMAPTTDIGASNTGKTLTIFDGGEWRWFDPS